MANDYSRHYHWSHPRIRSTHDIRDNVRFRCAAISSTSCKFHRTGWSCLSSACRKQKELRVGETPQVSHCIGRRFLGDAVLISKRKFIKIENRAYSTCEVITITA